MNECARKARFKGRREGRKVVSESGRLNIKTSIIDMGRRESLYIKKGGKG